MDGLKFTCRLTACTLGSSLGPILGNEYGKTLPLLSDCSLFSAAVYMSDVCVLLSMLCVTLIRKLIQVKTHQLCQAIINRCHTFHRHLTCLRPLTIATCWKQRRLLNGLRRSLINTVYVTHGNSNTVYGLFTSKLVTHRYRNIRKLCNY